jgi:uncharacterized membrane protein
MAEEVKKSTSPKEDKQVIEGKVWAILAYIGILCLLPLLLKKDNKFVLFHSKQGLVLFIGEAAAFLVNLIPVLGQVIFIIVTLVAGIFSLVGIIKVLMGEYWKAPYVSDIAEKINI